MYVNQKVTVRTDDHETNGQTGYITWIGPQRHAVGVALDSGRNFDVAYCDVKPVDAECLHEWVAGICVVNDQDLQSVVNERDVECDKCEEILCQGTVVPPRYIWGDDE